MAEAGGLWRVAVVGLGGIGNSVLHRLVRMPISTLTLIDGDTVEEDNLERQPLFALADVGFYKVDVAHGWLRLVSRARSLPANRADLVISPVCLRHPKAMACINSKDKCW